MSHDKNFLDAVADQVAHRLRRSTLCTRLVIPRADTAERTETNGWWRLVGNIRSARHLQAELCIDRWAGTHARSLWYGVGSTEHAAVARLAERLTKVFGPPILRGDADADGTGFIAGLSRREFGRPVHETYKESGSSSFYGRYVFPRAFRDSRLMIDSISQSVVTLLAAVLGQRANGHDMAFPEGREVKALHETKERSQRLASLAKEQALLRFGKLECEACGFDFEKVYGEVGRGFMEAHHLRPLGDLSKATESRLRDIALVCANCHAMLHRHRPWLARGTLHLLLRKGREN